MYQRIKQLADEALALQNKDRMDAALRKISALSQSAHDAHEAAMRELSTTGSAMLQHSVQHDSEGKIAVDIAHVPTAEHLDSPDTAEGGAQ